MARDAVLVAGTARLVITLSATAVSAAVTSAAAVSAAGWTAFSFTCFVARDFTVAEGRLVQALDRCASFLSIAHLDEAETTGAAGFAIGDDANLGHIAVLRKRIAQFAFSSTK